MSKAFVAILMISYQDNTKEKMEDTSEEISTEVEPKNR